MASLRIGFVLFPRLTQLGLTEPYGSPERTGPELIARIRRGAGPNAVRVRHGGAARRGGTDGGVMRIRLL